MVEHPLRGTLRRCVSEVSQSAAGSKKKNSRLQYGRQQKIQAHSICLGTIRYAPVKYRPQPAIPNAVLLKAGTQFAHTLCAKTDFT
jgi:hypothetical protein